MLVLLVVFMVTTPLLQAGMNVKLPRVGAKPAAIARKGIWIAVGANGAVSIGTKAATGEPVELDALPGRLSLLREKCSDCPVLLAGDGRASYEDVVRVLARLQAAGVTGVSLAIRHADAHVTRDGRP